MDQDLANQLKESKEQYRDSGKFLSGMNPQFEASLHLSDILGSPDQQMLEKPSTSSTRLDWSKLDTAPTDDMVAKGESMEVSIENEKRKRDHPISKVQKEGEETGGSRSNTILALDFLKQNGPQVQLPSQP